LIYDISSLILAGLAAGVVWGLGNTCYSLSLVHIPYATATAVWQMGLFVAGLWGIFAFHELKLVMHLLVFFAASVVIFSGIVLISVCM